MSNGSYDLIVIGAGAGGLQAAEFGAKLGAKVALIEKNRVGGDCTWVGCVPSKALLHVAGLAHATRMAEDYGIVCRPSGVDMNRVRAYVQDAVTEVYARDMRGLSSLDGLELVMGAAEFLDSQTIKVGERRLTARKFIIATGARPAVPAIPGLADVEFATYEQIFANETLPEHLLVLGAGPIGAELAQAYRRLGAKVTIIDVDLLPDEEFEVRTAMERVFAREGVVCVRGLATEASQEIGSITLRVGEEEVVSGDMLLVATGRRPNVNGLNLDAAGVEYNEQGIQVDENLRTSAGRIFAAGDCLGGPQFTHYAAWQGYKAARNALLPGNSAGIKDLVPRTTFTNPEISRIGLSESRARERFGDDAQSTMWPMDRVDRAVTDDARDGFIKVVHRGNGTLLGATIIAANAGELITEFVLGIQHDLKVADLAEAMHVYPTYSIGVQALAADMATESFLSSMTGKLVRRFSGFANEEKRQEAS